MMVEEKSKLYEKSTLQINTFILLIVLVLGMSSCISVNSMPKKTELGSSKEIVTSTVEKSSFENARERMVQDTIIDRGITDPDVIAAVRAVPRHKFVSAQYLDQSYADHPLPIGYGQTISQPYIVAWMTELLELSGGEKVLEIGTGSGYQAAVLAEMGLEVYSIEIIPELAESAAELLSDLGYNNVYIRQGDGYYGWLEKGLFDAIIVTAAPDHLPSPLVTQLVDGGRLVIPIGPRSGFQSLWKFVYQNGELKAYNLGGVAFVPFTGEAVESSSPVLFPTP
jgi:protein-L-isoaspartate(D-aspartate) O-methyltransferase